MTRFVVEIFEQNYGSFQVEARLNCGHKALVDIRTLRAHGIAYGLKVDCSYCEPQEIDLMTLIVSITGG